MIDAHLHLWEPLRRQYPWLGGIPDLNDDFLFEDYTAASADCGITGSVFVECAADEESAADEAEWILGLASDGRSGIEKVVASVWPESANFEASLQAIAEHPKLAGLRRVLHTEPDGLSQGAAFRANVASLARWDLTFDICMLERQLPLAIELVDACPDVRFVIDHCGVPDIAGGLSDGWRQSIARLAERPNVCCKVSGILLYAPPAHRTAEGVFPWFSHVIESFGWNRVLWGGDWPVCTLAAPLCRWVEVTHELLDKIGAGPAEREAMLDRNARSVYGLASTT